MTTIKLRRGTASEWTTANPILAAGEMGIETDTRKFKFGDGTTPWNTLAYASAEGGGGTGDVTAAGDNYFTGNNTFTGTTKFDNDVNIHGANLEVAGTLEATTGNITNLQVPNTLTSSGEINAVSIKSTGIRSDDIQTTANKKYLTEVDVDNQTIQVVDGKLHANLDDVTEQINILKGTKQDILSDGNGTKVVDNKVDIYQGDAGIRGLNLYQHNGTITKNNDLSITFDNGACGYIFLPNKGTNNDYEIVLHCNYLNKRGDARDSAISIVMCTTSTTIPLTDYTGKGGITIDTYNSPFRCVYENNTGGADGKTISTINYQKVIIKGTTINLQVSEDNSTFTDICTVNIDSTNNIVVGISNRLWSTDINAKWTKTTLYYDSYILDKTTNTYLMKQGIANEGVAVATSNKYGLVLPDNSTIVSNNGVLSSITPNNVVTTDRQQTISNTKTFSATQYFKAGIGLNGETYNAIRVFKNNTPITLAQYAGDVYLGDLDNETVIQGSTKITLDATTLTHKLDDSTEATIVDSSNISTYATGLSFPSNRYIDLTLGASGSTYTAPANGFVNISKSTNNTNQYLYIHGKMLVQGSANPSYYDLELFYPVTKNEQFIIGYSAGGKVNRFRFIYAEGEV